MVDAEGVPLKRRISAGPGAHRRNEGVGLRVSKWDSQIPFLGLIELDVLLQDIPQDGTVMTTATALTWMHCKINFKKVVYCRSRLRNMLAPSATKPRNIPVSTIDCGNEAA